MLRVFLLGLTLALASASLQARWVVYKEKHGKTYSSDEDNIRRYIYQNNLKLINEHNEKYAKGETTFYMGENRFTDMTNDEYRAKFLGTKIRVQPPNRIPHNEPDRIALPDTVDWRKHGYVTPIKDQGQCGSCWAFSTTGSVEGQHFNATGKLVSLSESNLVDCSQAEGNHGCQGGQMDQAFKYIIHNNGIDTEASYPYKPDDRPCYFNKSTVGATIKSFHDIKWWSESDLKLRVATVGPISAAIDAGNPSFQNYAGGVYNEPACIPFLLNHGVLVAGYGVDNGKDYWLVKNSWGVQWGYNGYIMMSRNKFNQCGIATRASYPIV